MGRAATMARDRDARRAEWRQVRLDLLGDPETEPDPAADLRTDLKQIQLIVWIATAKAFRRVHPSFGPGEIASAAWRGVIEALTAKPSKHVAKLDLRSQMLLRAKHAIYHEDYLGWRGCGKAGAIAQREAKMTPTALFSTLSRNDQRWLSNAIGVLHEAEPDPDPLVESALRELPPETARIARMFYLEELRCTEIAQALGLTINTVWGHIRRAKDTWGMGTGRESALYFSRRKDSKPPAAQACSNCKRIQGRKLCTACDTYRRRTGKDRPKGERDLRTNDQTRIQAQADALARAWGARLETKAAS
jgi:hypothetical protein